MDSNRGRSGGMSRPSLPLALSISMGLVALMAFIRLFIYRDTPITLTNVLPLLVCVWHRYRSILWGMAASFVVIAAIKYFYVLPEEVLARHHYDQFVMQCINIVVASLVIQAIAALLERLEARAVDLEETNTELETANEEITVREEEVNRQNEELQSQNEELEEQAEELRSQAEELEAQGEEMRALADELKADNEELDRREKVLGVLLGWAHSEEDDREVMVRICRTARGLLHGQGAAIVERRDGQIAVQAYSGEGDDLVRRFWPLERSFAALVMERKRTAYIDDLSRRPDLEIPEPREGSPFRSILATPFLVQGTALGAIEVYSTGTREWTAGDFRLVEWLATKCSLVLGMVRLQRERDAAAEAVRRSESVARGRVAELEAFMESSNAAIWVAHDPHCREVTANRAAHDLMRIPKGIDPPATPSGEAFRMPLRRRKDGRDLEPQELPMQVAARTGKEVVEELEILFDDGSVRNIYGAAVPIKDDGGTVQGVIATFVDITEKKELEKSLKDLLLQRDRLLEAERAARTLAEHASRAKDQFLAVLSHELRTPLSPVLMAATILENDRELPERLREDVQMIRRNVELEARLIEDMLDVTRIARGKMSLARRAVDGCQILHHALETCQAEAVEKGVELRVEIGSERSLLLADPARLQQVFWNLLKNAIKFTPPGGRITVRSSNRPSRNAPGQEALVVEVKDSGIGIAPEVLPRIFEVFEQGGEETTRHFGGLGLGLAISKGVVQLHEGTITAESEGAGKGAAFTVELPLADASPTRAEPGYTAFHGSRRAPAAASGNELSILLVEDHESTAAVLARLLLSFGYRVKTAGSMASAVSQYESERFDLVISDLGLPDGDGCRLIEQLIARRPVPAIALTGYGMESDIARSRDAGFLEHLTKPVSVGQLEAAIARITGLPVGPPGERPPGARG